MWRKILFCAVFSMMLVLVSACGKADQAKDRQDSTEVSVLPEDTYLPESSESTDELGQEKVNVTLYLPDENAEYLVPVICEAKKTPEGLIQALVEAGALPEGTEVNYFILKDNGNYISLEDEVASMSDKLTAEIDLSDHFMEGMQHTGTAGEAMLMGSLVNTMIENLNLKTIMVSANDEVIETGHCIYDEPQEFYQDLIEE